MCGIVGYSGNGRAYDFLISGLKMLEYRGYDSAGVAVVGDGGEIGVCKSAGKVARLESICGGIDGGTGIAHTRWATHGVPSDRNAHPHVSADGRVAIVHNGTIENYAVIKEQLTEAGYRFESDTDTEVLANLISLRRASGAGNLQEAVGEALRQVEGAYAIAVVERGRPGCMVVAKMSSPLAIGFGEGETFVASDATPFVGKTDKVMYLNDGEMAVIRGGEVEVTTLEGVGVERRVERLAMSVEAIEKGGYDSFMQKEIHEQPERLRDCMRGRIGADGLVRLEGVEENREVFGKVRRMVIVACGTSWHAGLIGKRLIQEWCGVPVDVEYASEFRYSRAVVSEGDIVVAISQSGETADTLAAVSLAKSRGAFVYYVCNVVGSSIPRMSDAGTYIHVGPEVGVASTKAFTGQVTVLTMLALNMAQIRGAVREETVREVTAGLVSLPKKIEEVIGDEKVVAEIAKRYKDASSFLYLGRGYNHPAALEGALKLKEISYAHAEGYPAAEMKHGPIALVDETLPCVVIAPSDALYDKTVSAIQQVKSRNGRVIAVATRGNDQMAAMADDCIYIPETHECLTAIVASVPLQLLAYYVATYRGLNVDQPRNLAKSVTVE